MISGRWLVFYNGFLRNISSRATERPSDPACHCANASDECEGKMLLCYVMLCYAAWPEDSMETCNASDEVKPRCCDTSPAINGGL